MVAAIDIYRAANVLAQQHGPEEAVLLAAKRCDALLELGCKSPPAHSHRDGRPTMAAEPERSVWYLESHRRRPNFDRTGSANREV